MKIYFRFSTERTIMQRSGNNNYYDKKIADNF